MEPGNELEQHAHPKPSLRMLLSHAVCYWRLSTHRALFKQPAICEKMLLPPHDIEVALKPVSLHNWGFSWNDMEVSPSHSGSQGTVL